MDSPSEREIKPARKEKRYRAGSFHAGRSVVVGLTGGIATGKTTVAQMMKEMGAKVISADEIVHQLLREDTSLIGRLADEFGLEILSEDGSVDRGRLGEMVFRDPDKLKRLEAIVHPLVIENLTREAEEFRRQGQGVLVLEIPLLFETASEKMVDKVLVVTAEQETQIRRLIKRYSISREEALLRIRSQLPTSEKEKYADWIVSTEGTLQSTKEQLQRVWNSLQKPLAHP